MAYTNLSKWVYFFTKQMQLIQMQTQSFTEKFTLETSLARVDEIRRVIRKKTVCLQANSELQIKP